MISKATEKAIKDAIVNTRDNAYRYKNFGKSDANREIGRKLEAEADEMQADLNRLKTL
jgi:hypothetical protein